MPENAVSRRWHGRNRASPSTKPTFSTLVGHRASMVQLVVGALVTPSNGGFHGRTDVWDGAGRIASHGGNVRIAIRCRQAASRFRHVVGKQRLRTRVIDCCPLHTLSQPSTFRIPLCFHNYASAPHHPTSANGDAPDHRRPDALHCPSYVSFVRPRRHLRGTYVSRRAALMCHNSIFHAFSRIVTHESAEMRLGNHPDQPLHPPIAPPRHALQPASALNPLQPSRTAFAALTGIALITALMSPRVSRSVLRAASTIFGSESVQCSTKSAILPYPAAAKIP